MTLDSGTKTIKSPDVNNDGFYEDFHDCTWIIRTNPFHQIVANFKSLDLHPCTMFGKTNTTEKCSCDYIEASANRRGRDDLGGGGVERNHVKSFGFFN